MAKILFPVDFSERAAAMRPYAAEIVRKLDAELALLHVVIPAPYGYYGGLYGTEGVNYPTEVGIETLKQNAGTQLSEFVTPGMQASSRGVSTAIAYGDPAEEIATFAALQEVDFILMPTHGYGRFRSLLLGSTAAKVLHDAACPVWTSAHVDCSQLKAQAKCATILCAVDFSPESASLVQRAMKMADVFGSQLRLVHAVPGAELGPAEFMYAEHVQILLHAAQEEMRKLLQAVHTRLRPDIDADVEGGSPAEVIREAAVKYKADLVVIGRGRLHENLGRLRSDAYAIIRDVPCPVLSI